MMRSGLAAIVIMMLTVFFVEARGQEFTFVPDDTVLSAPLGSEIVFNCTLTNTSTLTMTLAIVRVTNALPSPWESSMCLSVCFPSTTDSILTTPEFGSSPLDPGESRPFSLHVYTTTNPGTGMVRVLARDTRNPSDQRILTFTATATPVGVEDREHTPKEFSLSECYPNPFNPATTIRYTVPGPSLVTLKIFNLAGQEVAALANGREQGGLVEVRWDARDMRGVPLPSGIYFCSLNAVSAGGHTHFTAVRKVLLLR